MADDGQFAALFNSEQLRYGAKMKDSFSWLTPKQAGELAERTARHIQQLITDGKLSATKEDGKYYIDKAEFFRVFPRAHRKEQERNNAGNTSEINRLHSENDLLKQLTTQKDKEIEFLRNQIEYISQEKLKMLDTIVSHTRLLEHNKTKAEQMGETYIGSPTKKTWKDFFARKKET